MTKKDFFFPIEFSPPTHPDSDYYRIREATMSDATYKYSVGETWPVHVFFSL